MATNRSYNDLCGLAHALDLIGERWALLVIRELLLGPRRYSDLHAELPGISSNILAQRLDGLVTTGVATQRTLPPPAGSTVYELTDWGWQLEPVVLQLGRWGARSPGHPAGDHLSAVSMILSLRTNFDPDAADTDDLLLELVMNQEQFHVRATRGMLSTGRGHGDDARSPDAVVTTAPMTLAVLLYGTGELDRAVENGDIALDGHTAAVQRFLTWFALPPKADRPPGR